MPLAQWMPRTELRISLIALWVNVCLENAVKPINTFHSEHRTSRFNRHLFWVILGGWGSLRRFIHFYSRKKIESKIPWKEFGLLLFKYCLKTGPTFRLICQINMSVRSEMCSESLTTHLWLDEVFKSKKCLFTYYTWYIFIHENLKNDAKCPPFLFRLQYIMVRLNVFYYIWQSLGTGVCCACLIFCPPSYIHVYKRSYPSPRCACGGRAERPQMVYMNDNTSLIHQIKFRHNLNPCAHPRWLVEWSSTLWSIKLWPSIPK